LKWLGHLFRLLSWILAETKLYINQKGTRYVGKPRLTWFESVDGDLKSIGVRNLRCKSGDREQGMTVFEEAKVRPRTVMQEEEEEEGGGGGGGGGGG
jgi:hypothetical protein